MRFRYIIITYTMAWVIAFGAILFILALSGCITEQRCADRFPPHQSMRDSVRIKDSVAIREVPVIIERDSLIIHDSVPCKALYVDLVRKERNLTATIHIAGGKVSFKCAEDSLRAEIEARDHYISTIDDRNRVEVRTETKYINNWWDPALDWWGLISALILIGWALLKIVALVK